MTGQHVLRKGGLFGAKDTLWGKLLSVFIALAFALSMVSIVPAANAEGEEADAATHEAEHDALFDGDGSLFALEHEDDADADTAGNGDADMVDDDTVDIDEEDPFDIDEDVEGEGSSVVVPADADEQEEAEETDASPVAEPEDDWIDFTGTMTLPAGTVKTANSDKNTYNSGTVFLFCTSTHLGSIDLSTSAFPALGTKTGVAVGDLLGSKTTIKQDKADATDTYEFRYVKIQTETDGQVGGNYKDKGANAVGATASHLRYSAKDGAWQYLLAGTADNWVSLTSENVLIFYYSQIYDLVNKNDYQDASIVNFETQDWGSTTLRGRGQYSSASGQGAALIQLYDMNGSKVGSPMPIYYWSPCADKRACRVSVGDNWVVESVALKATQVDKITHTNNTVGQAQIPDSFDALTPVPDKENFIIPFYENHLDANGNKISHENSGDDARHNNVIIVGVQVSAKATEQDLIVNYYDADARDEGKLVKIASTQSVRAAGFKGNGTPQWTNYIAVADGAVSIKDGYRTEDGNLISVPTDLMNQHQTVSLQPKDLSAGYITPYADAAIVDGNTLNLFFDRDMLGNDPDEPGDIDYSDGIADKYQTIVTYGAVGGTLSMTSANDVTISGKTQFDYVVTLTDADGKPAVDGSYKLVDVDVPEGTAAVGFWGESPVWSPCDDESGTPAGSVIDKDGAVFIAYWGNGAINYFYDGELVSSVVANKGIGETIQFDAAASANKWREHDGKQYVLDRVEIPDTEAVLEGDDAGLVEIEVKAGDPGCNVLNVHYVLDEQGEDPEEPTPVVPEDPDPIEPDNPDPVIPDDPDPADPTPTPGATEPTPDPTPAPTPDETPGEPDTPLSPTEEPGTEADVTLEAAAGETPAPAPAPGAAPAAPGAAIATIVDDGTPLAALDGETIDDEGNPLASFHDPHCWTHWLMIFGAIVTIVYGLVVLYRRRSDVHDMDDFEDTITGEKRDNRTTAPVTNTAYQPM